MQTLKERRWSPGAIGGVLGMIAAMLLGLAVAPSSAAAREVVWTYDTGARDGDVQAVIDEWVAPHAHLSDAFRAMEAAYPVNQPGIRPLAVGHQFDGTVTVRSGVLTITLDDDGDFHDAAGWWQETLAAGLGITVGIAVRVMCVGTLALDGGIGLVASTACASIGGFVGGMTRGVVVQMIDGTLGDAKAWGKTLGVAIMTAVGAAAWEGGINVWSKTKLAEYLETAANWMEGTWSSWSSWVGQLPGSIAREIRGVAQGLADMASGVIGLTGVNLRIMPLGDSITAGFGSSTDSSYRAALWRALASARVDFVGSQRSGQLPDTDHEGHPGWLIQEVASITTNAVTLRQPNVVTLLIGTNDMVRNVDVAGAPARLSSLIDQVLAAAQGTTVLVASLTPSRDAAIQDRIARFNPQVASVVQRKRQEGQKVMFVDLGSVGVGDLADVVHPNDGGYEKIAQAFLEGLRGALSAGWVSAPNPPGSVPPPQLPAGGSNEACVEVPPGWTPRGQVARGGGAPLERTELADLNGDGRADYIVELEGGRGAIHAWINEGGDSPGRDGWRDVGQVAAGTGAPISQVRFADLTGDGTADYLVMGPGGSIRAWVNAGMDGPVNDVGIPNLPGWLEQGQVAAGTGHDLSQIQFADLDGDGGDDYLAVMPDGSVLAWLNNFGDAVNPPGGPVPGWLPQGRVASGAGPGDRVRFADIDGDRRDDYLVIGPSGAIDAWRNNGGDVRGGGWIPMGEIASGTGDPIERMRFVDMNGDHRDDLVVIQPNGGALVAWINNGGDRSRGPGWIDRGQIAAGAGPADRVRFADLNGDRRDDYLVVGSNGQLHAYLNNGGDLFGDPSRPQGSGWIDYGVVAQGTGDPIEELRFADFDGDNDDDYLVLDPARGALRVWVNQGGDVGGSGWRDLGQVAAGTGDPIDRIDFGDIDGDRRADYLVWGDDGSLHVWLNRGGDLPGGGGWQDIGVVAEGVGAARRQVRLAHLNCDGRLDYLTVDDGTGAVHAWVNNTGDPNARWLDGGQVAAGGGPGAQVRFADINGDGRDDYLVIDGNGALHGWLNAGGDRSVGGAVLAP